MKVTVVVVVEAMEAALVKAVAVVEHQAASQRLPREEGSKWRKYVVAAAVTVEIDDPVYAPKDRRVYQRSPQPRTPMN